MCNGLRKNRLLELRVKQPDDAPTIGIVLCSETDKDIARYSILKGNEKLFAVKYKPFLPDEDTLRREIEAQKELFRLQMQDLDLLERGGIAPRKTEKGKKR